MALVAGDEEISGGGFGALEEAVVGVVGGDGEAVSWFAIGE
jgi:hypothetical protein